MKYIPFAPNDIGKKLLQTLRIYIYKFNWKKFCHLLLFLSNLLHSQFRAHQLHHTCYGLTNPRWTEWVRRRHLRGATVSRDGVASPPRR